MGIYPEFRFIFINKTDDMRGSFVERKFIEKMTILENLISWEIYNIILEKNRKR